VRVQPVFESVFREFGLPERNPHGQWNALRESRRRWAVEAPGQVPFERQLDVVWRARGRLAAFKAQVLTAFARIFVEATFATYRAGPSGEGSTGPSAVVREEGPNGLALSARMEPQTHSM
jgi:hypothetical protein